MLTFNDLLAQAGFAPTDVAIILHTPRDKKMYRMLPWIVLNHREAFEEFQRGHSPTATATLRKRRWMASFVEADDRQLVFVGIYERLRVFQRSHRDIFKDVLHCFLRSNFDYCSEIDDQRDPDGASPYFDFRLLDDLADLSGRLVISPKLSPTYVRLAETLSAPVVEIARESLFDRPPPPWREWIVTAPMLRALPRSWAARLCEWRGIYHILDETDGARYVGAAYGEGNLLGRWQAHVANDHGITAELKRRNPENFRFTILERVSPDMDPEDVIGLERSWMARLSTRDHGLNS